MAIPDNALAKPLKLAVALLLATILYNVAEGVIAIGSGYLSGSIALTGFGLDSLIEVSASVTVLYHLSRSRQGVPEAELRNREKNVKRYVGWTFIALAIYIAYEAGIDLWFQNPPQASRIGLLVAIASIIAMPTLATLKIRTAKQLNSEPLEMEAKETLCCFFLSVILLAGLGLNVALGWWWADPIGGLLMLPWLIREGMEGIKGDSCCSCGH